MDFWLMFFAFFVCFFFILFDSFFFFFNQKTPYEVRISDWSSDVCSSDLRVDDGHLVAGPRERKALVSGSATHVDNPLRCLPHVPAQVLVDHVGANPAPERSVVVDEPIRQRRPVVIARTLGHGVMVPHALRSEASRVGKECVRTGRYRGYATS